MAQTPPLRLPPELTGTQGPAPVAPGGPSMRESLSPMVESPIDDFLAELLSIADDVGILDQAFQEPTVEDQVDLQDTQADPLQFLSREQLTILIQKFLAIPEPERGQLGAQLKEQLPPQVAQRLDAIVRMVQGGAQ